MNKFIREVFRDTAILSGLVILPMLFLGPGWRVPEDRQLEMSFSEVHRPRKDTPEEPQLGDVDAYADDGTGEGVQASRRNKPVQSHGRGRDIPMLRAFDVEREARNLRERNS
jgi:hypothetical protein